MEGEPPRPPYIRGPYNLWLRNPDLPVPESTFYRHAQNQQDAEVRDWEMNVDQALQAADADSDDSMASEIGLVENNAGIHNQSGTESNSPNLNVPQEVTDPVNNAEIFPEVHEEEEEEREEESETESSESESSESESSEEEEEEEIDIESVMEHLNTPLYAESDHSICEFLCEVTKFFARFPYKSALSEMLRIFVKFLPPGSKVPSTKHSYMRIIKLLSPHRGVHVKHFFCSNEKCHNYLGPINEIPELCDVCGNSEMDFFIHNSVKKSLKHLFENTKLAEIIEDYAAVPSNEGFICDIRDGEKYKELPRTSLYDITLLTNADGFPGGNSTKMQVWPLFSTICEIPPKLRKLFMLLAGIWCGLHKPTMNSYLRPYIEELEELGTTGFTWRHPKTKVLITSRVFAPIFAVDAQAKAPIQGMKQYNAGYSCGSCEIPGERFEAATGGTSQVFPYTQDAMKRNHQRMLEQAEKATPDVAEKGMTDVPVVALLPYVDLSTAFPGEYQHSVLLGTVRRLTKLSLDTKQKDEPFSFVKNKEEVSDILLNIKPPSYINRPPRTFNQIKDWKAAEYRHWELYYKLVCLRGKIPENTFQHMLLYTAALFILLQEKVSLAEIELADDLLNLYSTEAENIYGKKEMTYNLHQSLHLAEGVKNWGQLHHTSTFNFEDQNGTLKNMIKGSKNVSMELSNSMDIINSLHCLKAYTHDVHKDSTCILGAPVSINILDLDVRIYINESLNRNAIPFRMHLRARINGYIYASKYYTRQEKRNNTLISYGNHSFGYIVCFLDFDNDQQCCVVQSVKKKKRVFQHTETNVEIKHIYEYTVENKFHSIPLEEVNYCVIKLTENIFAIPPNFLEINL